MNNGFFYKLNSAVLYFDVTNDINKIRFNHYIMRKENIQRVKGTLPKGQFYMTVRKTASDLNLSISTISRFTREFIELGIIRLVCKGVKGKNCSIYSYISVEASDNSYAGYSYDDIASRECNYDGHSYDDTASREFNYDGYNKGDTASRECNYDGYSKGDTASRECNYDGYSQNDIVNSEKVKQNINRTKETNFEDSNLKLNLLGTNNELCEIPKNEQKNKQQYKEELSSNCKVFSSTKSSTKEVSLATKNKAQKETTQETKKKEYLNKINKKNIHQTIIKNIIDMLNEKTGKNFKINSPVNIKLINERLKEGYILEDFYKVIEVKVAKWKNTIMDMYIRPETLFSHKFESYVNESLVIKDQITTQQDKKNNQWNNQFKEIEDNLENQSKTQSENHFIDKTLSQINNNDKYKNSRYTKGEENSYSNCTTYEDTKRERKKHENVKYWNPVCDFS